MGRNERYYMNSNCYGVCEVIFFKWDSNLLLLILRLRNSEAS